MYRKRKITGKIGIVLLAAISVCISGCHSEQSELEKPAVPDISGEFRCSVLKCGQADAIILQTQNHCAVIDCGEEDDGDEVVKYLSENNIDRVDYLFITHFDKDHVGGVPEVIDHIDVDTIITPDYEGSNDEYENYQAKIDADQITPQKITEDLYFTLDDVLFEVYPPQRKSYAEGDNDFSLAIYATHGCNTFLFAGDAEAERLSEIMSQMDVASDFLKVPHHGRYNESTKKFTESVNPKYAVITCSEKNPAEAKVVAALDAVGCEVYYTKDGDILVTSDGENIKISQ